MSNLFDGIITICRHSEDRNLVVIYSSSPLGESVCRSVYNAIVRRNCGLIDAEFNPVLDKLIEPKNLIIRGKTFFSYDLLDNYLVKSGKVYGYVLCKIID